MKRIKDTLAGVALGCCVLSHGAQAAPVTSLLIGEIGLLSGGVGTSSAQLGGGMISLSWGSLSHGSVSFVSLGSNDGAILMGAVQGPGDFTGELQWLNLPAYPTTLNGAPSGSIVNNAMMLDFSGFTAEWNGTSFNTSPDAGTLTTAISLIGNGVYFYTADWTHLISAADGVAPAFHGFTVGVHLEGIAVTGITPVPEADTYAMMLAGLGLVGVAARRRRKRD